MKTPYQWLDEMRKECSDGGPSIPMIERIKMIQDDASKGGDILERIKLAWDNYQKYEAGFEYHAKEGGDCEYSEKDRRAAWDALNELIESI